MQRCVRTLMICPCWNLRKILENLRKKLRQKTTKCGESAERFGTCQEFAELFEENCGFGPNHEICCISRIAICAVDLLGSSMSHTVQIIIIIMESTA